MNLAVENLSVERDNYPVLHDVSFTLQPGIHLCLGVSGSGKSTLLQVLSGLFAPTTGIVTLDGAPLYRGKRTLPGAFQKVAASFQFPEHQLFLRTVREELKDAMRPLSLSPSDVQERSTAMVHNFGFFDDVLEENPLLLSGGQKRRIALAATMLGDATWTFLDEPTAGLDSASIEDLRDILHRITAANAHRGLLIATHDIDVFLPIVDTVLLIHDGTVGAHVTREEIYTSPDILSRYQLRLSPALALRSALQQTGMELPSSPLSGDDLAREIAAHYGACLPGEKKHIRFVENADAPASTSTVIEERRERLSSETVQRAGTSFQALDPRTKWIMTLLLSVGTLIQTTWPGLMFSFVIAFVMVVWSQVKWRLLLPVLRAFVFLLLSTTIISLFRISHGHIAVIWSPDTWQHWLLGARILVVMVLGTLLPLTTTQLDMESALNRMLRGLKVLRVPVDLAALAMALCLRFLPLIFEETRRLALFARARTKTGGRPDRLPIRVLPRLLVPLILRLLHLGEEISTNIELRGMHVAEHMAAGLSFTRKDRIAFVIVALVMLVFAGIQWVLR